MHCLIVDDDPLLCDLLEHFCSKIDHIDNVTIANNGFEAMNLVNQNSFDIILLDYNLPDITAKEILPFIEAGTSVIMVTANKDFGHESYNYDHILDFLVKPVEFTRFYKAIMKAVDYQQAQVANSDQLFIKDGNALVSVRLSELLFIRSAGNYAELVTADKKILTIMTLKDLEKKLTPNFQRVHRSCIVNITKVDRIANTELMIMGHEISISTSHKEELLKKIKFLK